MAELNLRNPKTKDEAVAFVSAVLRVGPALMSSDFQTAIRASDEFDIRGRDLLEYRRARTKSDDRTG